MNSNTSNPNATSKPENTMRRIVISTLLMILAVGLIFGVTGIAKGTTRNMVIILCLIITGALIIAIRGNLLVGKLIAPFGAALTLLFAAYNGKGFHDEILVGAPVAIVMAGLLLGNWGTVVLSVFLIAGITAIGLAEINGIVQSDLSALTSFEDIITVSLMIVAMAFVQRLLIKRLNNSLEEARRNAEAQSQANRELRTLQADLEQRVNERTMQLNRRAVQLQASSEVGRAVSSIGNLNELLENVTMLISERFGYYHAGIFLLDRAGENAVLRAANSLGGRRMLENGHSLPVGSKSMVGYVTQHREPRIAADVGREVTFFDNPDLPQTRSEMALPLIAAGKLLGALDVQSNDAGTFTQDDVNVLQVLADQVAIAIENSNLFAESREALEASKRAYGSLSREAWVNLLSGRTNLGYQSDSSGSIQPVEGGWSKELVQAQREGHSVKIDEKTLAIPFKILDLPAGVIRLKKQTTSQEWSEREINLIETLVGNLGEALESARLYEDTQRRAERERIASDISARIRESLDVDTVLQTAVLEMRRALNLEEITIRLGESNGQKSP